MRSRPTIWILLALLLLAGAWFFWPRTGNRLAEQNSPAQKISGAAAISNAAASANSAPNVSASANAAAVQTNEFPFRLSNTAKSIGELMGDRRAILLENALIDTRLPLNFSIPKNLQPPGDPGSYIVQANGPVTAAFRALLARAGAEIISYIPNNAYLVRVSAAGAGALSANALTAAVIPNDPYYKISSSVPVGTKQTTSAVAPSRNSRRQPSLLELAVKQKPLPPGTVLTLGVFNNGAAATFSQIEKLGGTILTTNFSPFGLMLRVAPPENWTALALLPGVHIVEPYHARVRANDLSRATTGVAVNSTTNANYLNLSGSNVLVSINDSGVDAMHPDFTTGGSLPVRVFGSAQVLTDTNGHGTHVAGIIAGNGAESLTVTNASGSINPGTNSQYRGKAPLAKLFVMDFNDSDQDLQAGAALTNALISNNSWNFDGDTAYDLEAASYDAATRDSLPYVTGSQGVLYVFSAGNDGNGEDDGVNGTADSILSPATAKDVITVGALEQQRDITNYVIGPDGSSNQIWLPETDTSFQVAGFSARGNVGIGTEGTAGRYKPDVVAPGTFVVSTRSEQWDQATYYYQNPTNDDTQEYDNIVIQPGDVFASSFPLVPDNAVQLTIQVASNPDSPTPFPDLPIFMGLESSPNLYDYETTNNLFSIPPDGPGIPAILNDQEFGFNYAVSNNTSEAINIDVITDIITTNSTGNEGAVLKNLNDSIGTSPYYYRYESGTSMAAGDVSGTLALMQDFFTNTLHLTPSPALLKALLINGARPVGNYNFNEADGRNYQGWGLINLPNSVPTNSTPGTNSVFYLDQSPTNALATGDSHTFVISIPTNSANLPLRVTVAWTDPPGNPAAAIKLVNNLDLVVSNLATNTVYYGNDIPAGSSFNEAGNTNSPNLDTINPEENVFLQPPLAASYSVTVIGRGVNVNAVTAQTNNVVQDYALAISSGDELTPGAITVTDQGNVSHPTSDQLITDVIATNAPLLNQFVGANSPLLGTNTISAGGNIGYATNALITVGMTNQWHFYIVTNTTSFTNAAFITFLPDTLSIPRMGVFADSDANSTVPEADIDLYVATEPGLTNLDPTVISNCVYGLNGDGASLSQGGTEFVAYTNSTANKVYYIGVKSETQVASEFAFLPVFSQLPFSQLNPDGSQTVNGVPLPVAIPDGSPAHPGVGYVFGLALYPMAVQTVTVSNQIVHQNFGDLIGTLGHNDVNDVLNNHDSLFNSDGVYDFLYDDSQSPLPGSQPSDGPGTLLNYVGQQAVGPWILTEVDDSQSQTGSVTGFSLTIQPHIDPSKGVNVSLQPGQFYTTYVDVPLAATNLSIFATNITGTAVPPVELFVRYNTPPTQSNYDATTLLNNGTPPGGSISIGATSQPPLRPGRYFISLFNPGLSTQNIYLITTLGISPSGPTWLNFNASGPTPLPDDAVTTSSIFVPETDPISAINVGIRVDHPRISDLVFHLISPDGTRYLLMENRGGTSTNGAGVSYFVSTNTSTVGHDGDADAYTNTINTGTNSGSITLNYDLYQLPDTIDVYYQGVNLFHLDPPYTGSDISGTKVIPYTGTSTFVTIIINAGGNTNYPNTAWTYNVTSTLEKYDYLTFTDDTNLTTTPIKFAPPPFVPFVTAQSNLLADGFEQTPVASYTNGQTFGNGWKVITNQVSVVADPANAYAGSNFLALASGTISTNLSTIAGQIYKLTFAYRGPGIVSLWRGENNANDSISGNNGTPTSITYGAGEVGQAFVFDGSSSQIQVPASSSLNVGLGSGFTIDMWINPPNVSNVQALCEWNSGTGQIGVNMGIGAAGVGVINGNITSTAGVEDNVITPPNQIVANIFQHIALTYNKASGLTSFYWNGSLVATTNVGIITPQTSYGFFMGNRPSGIFAGSHFQGMMDEPSLYNRTISASEVKAIYQKGSLGKYDVSAPSIALGMAEAQVTLDGSSSPAFFGANTNWQTNSITFIATTNGTPLTIAGIEPGMLLDNFNLASVSSNNLDYFPEQSITPLVGTSPRGVWQMEVQDDRVGAYDSNSPPMLVDWQLSMVLASTNPPVPAVITTPATNVTSTSATLNALVNPDGLTTTLFFEYGTTTNYGLFSTSVVISTNLTAQQALGIAVTNLAPDTSYHFQAIATNASGIFFGGDLTFFAHTGALPYAATLPASIVTGTSAQLNGMATPNGLPSVAWFQWGTSTLYGNQTPPVSVGSGYNVVYTNSPVTGLTPNVPYHFRLVVSNAFAVVYGYDQVLDQANVVAWGADYAGQINVPVNLSNAVAVAGAYDHSLAIKNDGTAIGWGDNSFNQATVPSGLSNLVAVAGGEYYSMALNANGTVTAWGANILSQTNVPAGLNNVVEIAGGTFSSLALKADGTVVAWGANFFGLTNVPAGLSNVVAIAGGSYHSLALKADGTVVAWGDNGSGQTNVPVGLSNVVAVAAGNFHNLALKSDGTVVAWGDNSAGQTNVPAGLTNVVAIAAGGFNSLALKSNGTVIGWGDNTAGQDSPPVGLTNIVAIASGYFHTLALTPQSISSLTNPVVLALTNGVTQTNTIAAGGITYYQVNVPTNADFATNFLYTLNASQTLTLWFSTNTPPSITQAGDVELLADITNGVSILAAGSGTPKIVPGATYYLGVQNTNSFSVAYGIGVDFHLVTSSNMPPVPPSISSIVYTNIGGTNGFLLSWFAPTNDQFQVQWTASLTPPQNWQTFSNIITYTGPLTATNGLFTFFDDGSQTGGFGPQRFYRLILLGSASPTNTAPVLPPQAARNVTPLSPLIVTNTATDSDIPAQTLTYTVSGSLGGTNLPAITTNGVITWTPTLAQAGLTNTITTIVTDNGAPPLGATNSFLAAVNPIPAISSVTLATNALTLHWFAPTNDQFNVQWATNLAPVINWTTFSNGIAPIVITSTNGAFSFTDTNALFMTEFYRLILLP